MKFTSFMFIRIKDFVMSLSKKQFVLSFCLILLICFVVAHVVFAETASVARSYESSLKQTSSGEGILDVIAGFLAPVFYLVFILLPGWALALVTRVLVWVLSYQGFADETIINKGWTILRDLSNMFFIIVLVVVAIGTIVKSSRYGYQQNLRRLILMAILINFSKTITLFFIDLSQAVTISFVNAFLDAIQGGIPQLLGLTGWLTLQKGGELGGGLNVLVQIGLGGIMLMVALVVICVITFLFFMRIIFFTFLIILSPIAFLCSTLPTAQKYYQEWWDMLGKYLVLGPTLAFFLWLSFAVVNIPEGASGELSKQINQKTETAKSLNLGQGTTEAPFGANLNENGSTEVTNETNNTKDPLTASIIRFFVAISLLFGSLMMAGKLGTVGAGISKQASGKITGAMSAVGKRALVGRTGEGGLRSVGMMATGNAGSFVAGAMRPVMANRATRVLANVATLGAFGGVNSVANSAARANRLRQERSLKKESEGLAGASIAELRTVAATDMNRDKRRAASQKLSKTPGGIESERAHETDIQRRAIDAHNAEVISSGVGQLRQHETTAEAQEIDAHNARVAQQKIQQGRNLRDGGEATREDYEKWQVENISYVGDPNNANDAERATVMARAVNKGEEDKLIANMSAEHFASLDPAVQRGMLQAFSAAGGSMDSIEKGVKRWAKSQQEAFAEQYATAFANGTPVERQRSLSMLARLNPGGLVDYVNDPRNGSNANVAGGFARNTELRNVVSSMTAENLVKMNDTQLETLSPYLNKTQVKGIGEKGSIGQQQTVIMAITAPTVTRDIEVVKHIMSSDTYAGAVAQVQGNAATAPSHGVLDREWQANRVAKQEYENKLAIYRQHGVEEGIIAHAAAVAAGTTPTPPPVPPNVKD